MEIKFYNASQIPVTISSITGGGVSGDPIIQKGTIPPNVTFPVTIFEEFGYFIEQVECTISMQGFSASLTLNDASFLNGYQNFSVKYQGGCSVGAPHFNYCFPITIIPLGG
ncbi:hypothetical protein Xsto_01848 [Xenorhabdus stockiae]|uniref:Uncharacterized protein n=1 Tax=Xenorhabdus stockiae TaxID=351614 RepID=A0A2D0KQK5_9GAMM|nr:hypothetical protein [Xenorhabdus stockiae]PHM65696.1 hypothetical protein Xsto_01848 [Xenorhabdus stockiae]